MFDEKRGGLHSVQAIDVTNKGLIEGDLDGIKIDVGSSVSKTFTITNAATGSIIGGDSGIVTLDAGTLMTVKNAGTISGLTSEAISFAGTLILTNTGTITAFHFIGTDLAFNKTAGELRAISDGPNLILQGDVNGDGNADFSIGLLGTQDLQTGDFVV